MRKHTTAKHIGSSKRIAKQQPNTVYLTPWDLAALLECDHRSIESGRLVRFDIPCKVYTPAECKALEQELSKGER